MSSELDTTVCGFCGTTITYDGSGGLDGSDWTDGSGGDCCWGDDDGNNDGNPHTPWKDNT